MARKGGVYGAKGVSAAFRELAGRKLYSTPVSQASRFALQPILKAAKQNTPHQSVKKALTIKKNSRAPKSRPATEVGGDPQNPDFRLLHLLEFGTDEHPVNHPGTAPQPFLTPAYEQHGQEAIQRFGQKLGPAIEKQATKLAKKYAGKK